MNGVRGLKHHIKKFCFEDDTGIAMATGLFVITLSFAFAVLIIDVSQLYLLGRSLQQVVDAAAISSAMQLNPILNEESPDIFVSPYDYTLEGWQRAKLAFFEVLKGTNIFRVSPFLEWPDQTICKEEAVFRGYDPDERYGKCIEYEFPQYFLRIERGLYLKDGAFQGFRSLENKQFCDITQQCLGIPSPDIANAVRITITIKEFKTVFAGIQPFNQRTLSGIWRSAFGAQGIYDVTEEI